MIRIIQRYRFTILTAMIGALLLALLVSPWTRDAAQKRQKFIQDCGNTSGQIVITKTVYYCIYPNGRMIQG